MNQGKNYLFTNAQGAKKSAPTQAFQKNYLSSELGTEKNQDLPDRQIPVHQ